MKQKKLKPKIFKKLYPLNICEECFIKYGFAKRFTYHYEVNKENIYCPFCLQDKDNHVLLFAYWKTSNNKLANKEQEDVIKKKNELEEEIKQKRLKEVFERRIKNERIVKQNIYVHLRKRRLPDIDFSDNNDFEDDFE